MWSRVMDWTGTLFWKGWISMMFRTPCGISTILWIYPLSARDRSGKVNHRQQRCLGKKRDGLQPWPCREQEREDKQFSDGGRESAALDVKTQSVIAVTASCCAEGWDPAPWRRTNALYANPGRNKYVTGTSCLGRRFWQRAIHTIAKTMGPFFGNSQGQRLFP